MAWNTARHVEAWYAVMGMGAVCHTLNPRLFADQLCYIISHAEDKILIVDATFLPLLAEHRAKMETVRHIIVLGDEALVRGSAIPDALASESLIAAGCSFPTSLWAASTKIPPAASATPPAPPEIRRASSTPTARTSFTPW